MNKSKHMSILISAFSAALIMASATTSASESEHWSYQGHDGPEYWATLADEYSLCSNGQNQSPINLNSTVKSNLFSLRMDYYNVPLQILNNGHTIQINYTHFDTSADKQVNIAGKEYLLPSGTLYNSSIKISGEKYQLLQVHFHSPSEHQLNGKHHALEAHFVHANSAGQLAVVGVMFKTGAANDFLTKLWEFMPGEAGPVQNITGMTVNAKELLPENLDYYHYRGSLTTPPCSEAVRWFVLKNGQTLSSAQLKQFLSVVGENNRPVQKLNARFLLQSK
ncbi:MAG: carbonic anhydrase family protein [Colwellia sp.]|nr:carbonic anhydrase family protein [Colwellia sp.]